MATMNPHASSSDDTTLYTSRTPSRGSTLHDPMPSPPFHFESDLEHAMPKLYNPEAQPQPQQVTEPESEKVEIPDHDPNIIDWDSPEDPDRAVNWSTKKKWGNILIIACITFLTPLASSMMAPAVPMILDEFGSDNQTIGTFLVSIYVLGYALGPLFIAPMSEIYGRLPVYHICNTLFVIWTIACAVAPNLGSLLVFRLLEGLAGSCPVTIGAGSIADIFVPEARGTAVSLWTMGPLLGPVVGPVAAGFLSEAAGWRWTFWVITIAAGVCLAGSLLFLRETYEPVLLQKRVNQLKKVTGNPDLRSKLAPTVKPTQHFLRSVVRPTKMLIFSPICLVFAIFIAVVYSYLYLVFTTITNVYGTVYNFNQGAVGLTFLGIGVGSLLGLGSFGIASDKLLKHLAKKHGHMKPEFRLPPLIPGSLVLPIGLFWYGWSADKHLHWMMPITGTGFIGFGVIATFMPVQTYMVDSFNSQAASAIAANTVLRSLAGCFLPLAGPKMYETLGLGWGNSLLGFIALTLLPTSIYFYKYGEKIRTNPKFQINL